MPKRQEQKEKSTGRDASDWISNLPQEVWTTFHFSASRFVQKKSHLHSFVEMILRWSPSLSHILTAGSPPLSCCSALTAVYSPRTLIIKYNLSFPISFFPFIPGFFFFYSLTHLLPSCNLLKFLTEFFSGLRPRGEFSSPLAAHWGQRENALWFRGALDYQLSFHDHLSSLLQSSTWVFGYRKHHSREAGCLRRLRAEGYNHIFICQSEKGNPGAKLAQNKPHDSDCKGGKPEKFYIQDWHTSKEWWRRILLLHNNSNNICTLFIIIRYKLSSNLTTMPFSSSSISSSCYTLYSFLLAYMCCGN